MRTSAKICALVAAATFGAAAGAEGVVIHRMSQSGDRVAVTLSTELAPLEEVVRREAPGAVERATRGSRELPLRPVIQVAFAGMRFELGDQPARANVTARWTVTVTGEVPRFTFGIPPRIDHYDRIALLREDVVTEGTVTLQPESTSLLHARLELQTVRFLNGTAVPVGSAPLGVIDLRPRLVGALANRPVESLRFDSFEGGRVTLTATVPMPPAPPPAAPPPGDEPVLPPE